MCVFIWIQQHSKFLLHTLHVLYMRTLCDSTNINTIMSCKHTKRLLTAVRHHLSKLRSKRKNEKLLHTAHHKRKTPRSIGATTYSCLKCIVYDKLLKPRQSIRITLYMHAFYGWQSFILYIILSGFINFQCVLYGGEIFLCGI